MRKILSGLLLMATTSHAQTNPVITNWLINTSGTTGKYYLTGSSTPVADATPANVQEVSYSATYAYIKATGIPSYTIGPYALGIISKALNNNYTFKLPLNPIAATTPTTVGMGATAVFINGTVAYAARDAATYNGLGKWHQNAVFFENLGFDCAHGHPGPMSSDYHAHQNPSAFKVSTTPTSSICNVYLADGLYVPNSAQHGPLIGFAPDGFPIYGAYGYTDPNNSSSPIKRMVPGYRLRSITSRTTLPDGTAAAGPSFTETIPGLPGSTPLAASLGAYEEDYEYVTGLGDLDAHNGRFCKTPEYPAGIYCYFATIDADNVPVYPYLIGTTYYGAVTPQTPMNSFTKATISEPVTKYVPVAVPEISNAGKVDVSIFPNPTKDLLVVQCSVAKGTDRQVVLIDLTGKVVAQQTIAQGSTMCYFNVEVLYPGMYLVNVVDGEQTISSKVMIK